MNTRNPAAANSATHAAIDSAQTHAVQMLQQTMPHLHAVYGFGSAGTQYERPNSDMDLAVLCARPEDPVTVWKTAQAIATQIGRDVDLVDLRRASTVMAANIVAHGTRLVCADTTRCAEFEAYTLADYARLNEERAGILEDIQARGSIHAG